MDTCTTACDRFSDNSQFNVPGSPPPRDRFQKALNRRGRGDLSLRCILSIEANRGTASCSGFNRGRSESRRANLDVRNFNPGKNRETHRRQRIGMQIKIPGRATHRKQRAHESCSLHFRPFHPHKRSCDSPPPLRPQTQHFREDVHAISLSLSLLAEPRGFSATSGS